MLEPLGQSQVLAYLKRLTAHHRIHLISFEKSVDWENISERIRIAKDIAESGIIWHPLMYHKRPSALATAWDIFCGILIGLYLIIWYRLRILHARSYVSSVIALALKRTTGLKFLFDMRGFWADERVEGGIWTPNCFMFDLAKWFEKRFFLAADHVVSLTNAANLEIQSFAYLQGRMPSVTVIPTCTDLLHFTPMYKKRDSDEFFLGYVGSVGTWYLFDVVALCFAQLIRLRPNAKLLIVNRGQHEYIRSELAKANVHDKSYEIVTSNHNNIQKKMSRMNAGIFFYKSTYSRVACAPTKLGEFLGCGIPCISNVGVGDMAEVLEGERVGIALTSFDKVTLTEGLNRLLLLTLDPAIVERCVSTAKKHFSLEEGIKAYSAIYEKLSSNLNE